MHQRTLTKVNIRVYALIINEKNEILISDEIFRGIRMTKFPGGGLDLGEGTIDCLKREAREEFGQEIEVLDHYYTTDYFQRALFFEDQQLISIYYMAKFKKPEMFVTENKHFDFDISKDGLSFRWIPIVELKKELLTFPIDKRVAEMLQSPNK